ncbi:MAG: NPCBM/NEW2 domain-containing protein [Spirochaetia bacterium]|nr:NPCBM/NEW2 domain-containing protein [Spirochaetia bacterium]
MEECDLSQEFPIQNEMDYLYFGGPYPDGVIEFFPAGSEGFKPRKIPARLLVADAFGKTKIETFPRCLSVLPDSGCQLTERWAKLVFDLSGSDFRRFTCTAGLSADLGFKNEVRGNVNFQVLGDESVLFERKEMRGGETAVSLDLDLRGRKKLTLLVRGEHRIQEEFWLGHFIWGNPRLSKKQES